MTTSSGLSSLLPAAASRARTCRARRATLARGALWLHGRKRSRRGAGPGYACRMAATKMDGAALAARIRAEVAAEVAELGQLGLATVLVGDDPASQIYIGKKHKAATRGGHRAARPPPAGRDERGRPARARRRAERGRPVDGILVQLPLPGHIDESRVLRSVAPGQGRRRLPPGERRPALPRTSRRFVPGDAARDHGPARASTTSPLKGAERRRDRAERRSSASRRRCCCCSANATVTICHSRTADLARTWSPRRTSLVAAVGRAGIVIGRDGQAGGVRDRRRHEPHREPGCAATSTPRRPSGAALMTPVPGGVGPMTIAMLLRNTRQGGAATAAACLLSPAPDANVRAASTRGRRLGARAVVCLLQ